ncbi:MAG: hypothetical protein OXG72_03100 [Acidobacteria bacterium]|nr:hypothetical protein [Acidobacteriota bacterium]
MKRHYITIPPSVAAWVPDGAKGNWRDRIVQDVAGGNVLVVEPMPSNDLGVRAAVHGDRYYIEIGKDRDPSRSDTVFLMRVESADQRLPRRLPVKVDCEVTLWPGGVPPTLDPVDDLFDSGFSAEFEGDPASGAAEEAAPEVSPLLKRLLSAASDELRLHVRPGTDVEEADEPAAFLAPFRSLWSRLRLDRYLRLSPRHDALIRGHIKPQSLPPTQRADFKAAFGVELLHRIAGDDESRVADVARAIASIPIQATDRAAIWLATLDSLSGAALRRELHDSTSALSLLAVEDTACAREWRLVIAPGLVDLARTSDDELRSAVEDGVDPSDALKAVITWAGELAYHDERPEDVTAEVGNQQEPGFALAAAPSASGTSPRADNWVMSLRLADRGPFERLHSVLARAAALRPPQATLASIEDVASFHALAEEVESRFGEWREAVGNVKELEQDLQEARAALRRLERAAGGAACSIVGEGVTPRDATEIAELLESPALEQAPHWLLRSDATLEHTPTPKTKAEWASVLVDAQRRSLVHLFCNLAAELNEPEFLGWIATPGVDDDLERHLRESLVSGPGQERQLFDLYNFAEYGITMA